MSNAATTPLEAGMPLHATSVSKEPLTFSFVAAATTVMLACGISGQALIAMHYNYSFGSVFEKIHPVTYIGLLFLFAQFFIFGRKKLLDAMSRNYGPLMLALGATFVALYAGLYLSVPGTGLPDTWVLPAEIFLLCIQLNRRERGILRNMLNALFVVNSMIGIAETIMNKRLIPLAIANSLLGDYAFPIEWRAGALLGHPLANSYLTGCFILLLVFDSRIKNFWLRLGALGICSISMLAFGSRAGSGLLVIFLLGGFLWKAVKTLFSHKISLEFLIYFYVSLFALVGLVPMLLFSGFADRFLARLAVDHGSADARVGAIELTKNLSLSQLVTGIPHMDMVNLGTRFKIGDGIENFWLSFLITFGLIGYALLMPGLLIFCRNLIRSSEPKLTFILVYFFGCCSTSVSLSSKSLMLGIVTALYLTSRSTNLLRSASGTRAVS